MEVYNAHNMLMEIAAAAGIERGEAFTAEAVVRKLGDISSLADATAKLKGLSLYDIRAATQAERADFVTVCHALAAEVDRENARGMTFIAAYNYRAAGTGNYTERLMKCEHCGAEHVPLHDTSGGPVCSGCLSQIAD